MKHSVVLTSFNRPFLVSRAILSVLNQRGDYQLIVSDDGSDSATISTISSLIEGRKDVVLLTYPEGERGEKAATRAVEAVNRGLQAVEGDLIHYLSDDDFFAIGRFSFFDQVFSSHQINMACGDMLYLDARGRVLRARECPPEPFTNPVCVVDQKQVVHRTECLEGPWEAVSYQSDGEYFKKLVEKGHGPIYPFKKVVAYHQEHSYNLCSTQWTTSQIREEPVVSLWDTAGVAETLKELWQSEEELLHRQWLVKEVQREGGSCLEVGCGTGEIGKHLEAYTGLDSSKEMLQLARQATPQHKWVEGDARVLPFKDQSFDTVFSFEVLGHLSKPEAQHVLSEMARVSKERVLLSLWVDEQERLQEERVAEEVFQQNTFCFSDVLQWFKEVGLSVTETSRSPAVPTITLFVGRKS